MLAQVLADAVGVDPRTICVTTGDTDTTPFGGGTWGSRGTANGGSEPRTLGPTTLEVAILDANRPRRAFRRVTGSALEALLPEEDSDAAKPDAD